MQYSDAFLMKFWSKVRKTETCWLWIASRTKFGYGQLQARAVSQAPLLAHRISWQIHKGEIPAGMGVLHNCPGGDNPACINPDHLFLGDQLANMQDAKRKGRTTAGNRSAARKHRNTNSFVVNHGSGLKGEKHQMAKLSDLQVESLLQDFANGIIKARLAEKYEITKTHVGRLIANASSGLRSQSRATQY